ncbi:uncharacterized protein LACBIDRAFT_297221 [Laccaria bicolor S238N-H82]|uniref:Predicted protein n=1 Tax=Laccaria bicolor (strain S238N-H82 / ATCC MYA-4686) TaxID=486041 RepID=B0DAA4_LACBS|nr:uncharacterized protein LACBIDRAFT_297221 [Laccaria bicolor S238N-H82]EDR08493.1 predicted protein [Laccaria bicolor S238N-H82]|eukprot:XP_001880718.1 predicted protein [Laccaria bicolor S238N-H82]
MSNSPPSIILVCTENSHCAISSISNPGMYVKYHLNKPSSWALYANPSES